MQVSSDQVYAALNAARARASNLSSVTERWAVYDAISDIEKELLGTASHPSGERVVDRTPYRAIGIPTPSQLLNQIKQKY